jgi:hypothetical protein
MILCFLCLGRKLNLRHHLILTLFAAGEREAYYAGKNMRFACACLLFLILQPVFGGWTGFAQKRDSDYQLWLVRSQTITDDLLKDAGQLSSLQRAVLWVKLAQRWWREDPGRATSWITNAIQIVEQVPNKETPEERSERLETARVLLTIVTPLDQKLAKRLLTVLISDKSMDNERGAAANALIDAAVSIVEENPKRAAELGALALRTGRPNNNINELFFPLRARDPKLADSLFVQALVLAKQDPRSRLVNSLTYVAFPVQRGLSSNIPVPPEPLRIEVLQILVGLVNANPAGSENSNCGVVRWLAPFFTEIERLLPQQMLIVRQAINTCQATSPLDQQRIVDNTRSQPLNTVESLLKAAADTKETSVRTDYEYRAAALAQEGKNYELALKILDDMSKEQRESLDESWTSARWDWATDGALEHYQNGRFREMNLMLDAVPLDLQPLARAAFITRLRDRVISETAPIIQILNDAITGLRRSSMPEADKYQRYFGLLRWTIKYQPADANALLKNAIASLNQVKDGQALDTTDYLKYIGAPLVEMDEFVVKDALALVTLAQTRAQLRLALLDATLRSIRKR